MSNLNVLVTCVDELGQERQPGDTWDVDGLMGMSCTCLEGGDTDCSFGAGGFGNYGFGNYGWQPTRPVVAMLCKPTFK